MTVINTRICEKYGDCNNEAGDNLEMQVPVEPIQIPEVPILTPEIIPIITVGVPSKVDTRSVTDPRIQETT